MEVTVVNVQMGRWWNEFSNVTVCIPAAEGQVKEEEEGESLSRCSLLEFIG